MTLPEVLRRHAHLLGGATFIGRHEGLVDDSADDGSRWYSDPGRPGRRYQSVTWTISSTENAPWVLPWAGTVAAETVRDNWAQLGALMRSEAGPDAMVKWLKDEARRQRELAAAVGTWLHDVLEALLTGNPIPDPPEWMLGRTLRTGGERIHITQSTLDQWADGLLAFITDYRLEVVMSEASIANPREGYATRTDLVADLPGHGLACVDLKSGNVRRSVRAQLAAMIRATEVWIPGGGKIPMPRCDVAAVLHLRPRWARGYKLQRLQPGEIETGWGEFQAACRLLQLREAAGGLDGAVMYPPTFGLDGAVIVPTLPMVEDLGIRSARALTTAGLEWLADLEGFTATDLLQVRGVGPKAIDDIRRVMADHGLTLAGEHVVQEVA